LANSRYATVRQHPEKETVYLYIKTIERAHLPSKLWQRIKLSNNYQKALEQIDQQLIYWPKFMIHKCKQRLTRLIQVQIRSRRIAAEQERLGERLVPKLAPKIRTREAARERKAESAARLERTIERELLKRLRSGNYGEQPLNVSEAIWKKVLNAMEREGEAERDEDMDSGIDSEEEEDDLEKQVEYVSDIGESEEELEDLEDWLESEDEDEDEDEEEDEEDEDEEDSDDSDADRADAKKRKRTKAAKKNVKRAKVDLNKFNQGNKDVEAPLAW